MRDSIFLLIIIGCAVLLSISVTFVFADIQPTKTIGFNWIWDESPSFCFYTEQYQNNSRVAIDLWNEALPDTFIVDYRFVNFTTNTSMCNNHVMFYPTVATHTDGDVLGYADCRFNQSWNQYCFLVLATSDRDYGFDYDTSLTITLMMEIGHSYGLKHSQTKSNFDFCIDDVMHTPHCEKTLQILPFHVKAIECRYGSDGWAIPNYPECRVYEEYVE